MELQLRQLPIVSVTGVLAGDAALVSLTGGTATFPSKNVTGSADSPTSQTVTVTD
jgi:hypothetical protein